MEFKTNRDLRLSQTIGSINNPKRLANDGEYCINFYTSPPMGKISLEDAEDMVTERLNLLSICDEMLKGLEKSSTFRRNKMYFETLESRLLNAESKFDKNFYYLSTKGLNGKKDPEARKRDITSHWLLRLYYCQTDELKKWFISRECELLRVRLMDPSLTPILPEILAQNGFNYEKIEESEKKSFLEKISWNLLSVTKESVIYKIRFEESLEAVRSRKVFLNNGFAYILVQDMVSVICSKFRSQLSHALALSKLYLHELEEEQRLIPRLHSLHLHVIDNRKSNVKSEDDSGREVVTPQMIDPLSKESFPPCMQNIHEILRKEHHLRHYGRLHYGLFLKGIGLSLEDALDFFRQEFTKKLTPDKFQKEYSYNIRYNYGKEGKRIIGKAYSCQKIINDNPPATGDSHGCPFKHFDNNNLKIFLRKQHIDENNISEMLEMVEKDQNYSMACSKYFSCKHQWYPNINVYHPNQYYTESRKAFHVSTLTPPQSGQTNGDISMIDSNKIESIDESIFDAEDDFDRSVGAMDLDLSVTEPFENNDSTQ
ncbi:DNA primase large subunit-like [Oppia nitens]|uniref:DNA primase large subunit-like n=1 Tax=Oppia nitens TaxID=1686743 RepID=UPI0023DC9F7A|nr:DNA primase large subunit-like [Oppia nitens]